MFGIGLVYTLIKQCFAQLEVKDSCYKRENIFQEWGSFSIRKNIFLRRLIYFTILCFFSSYYRQILKPGYFFYKCDRQNLDIYILQRYTQ